MSEKYCNECGTSYGVEKHHIISRKQVKPLEDCKHVFVYLCYKHHRDHKTGVHFNRALYLKYKLQFQNYLETHLLKEFLTREEIKEVLEIKDKPLDRLLSSLILHKGKYAREDVILACMAKKKVTEEDILELEGEK
ncbi:hypothetical protein [Clostridium saccharoperbutylacetonicum]|uniref:hypothetical protein n=1 Tax=Clostridium saccharoperbutylacetonicum TaxID=36745 RepID=UPI0009839824|nr:hypothetical protein [Clostridium saccharoperbutylacetonicum]AQR95530.1 hypothetical protein CLSAP_28460 [Clostridium saccharoperbutylacetonicum]NSB31390.1 hypothetical protein [Clostridium saccharoperbutylacetonicum]